MGQAQVLGWHSDYESALGFSSSGAMPVIFFFPWWVLGAGRPVALGQKRDQATSPSWLLNS